MLYNKVGDGMKKVIIVGGGASGLTAAICLKRRGIDVTILEKNKQAGKKILVTGSGKCNYFNEEFDLTHFTANHKTAISNIITEHNVEKTKEFLESLGIIPRIKNGYYYPNSLKAVSIQNSLFTELRNLQIPLLNEVTVEEIIKTNHFILKTSKGQFEAENVIVASGSKAYYNTEEPSFLLNSLENLGHTLVPIYPGLVQLKAKGHFFKEWAGIRTEAKLSLFIQGERKKEVVGEVQLTDYGISGICTMLLSNILVPKLQSETVEIQINFLEPIQIETVKEARQFLEKRNVVLPNRTISELLDTILDYKLTNVLLHLAGLTPDTSLFFCPKEELETFLRFLVCFPLEIIGHNSFKEAQICLGGVDLNEINVDTMESKKVKQLYIIGEVLDMNGDCGGYNLGFAWMSGILAGNGVLND